MPQEVIGAKVHRIFSEDDLKETVGIFLSDADEEIEELNNKIVALDNKRKEDQNRHDAQRKQIIKEAEEKISKYRKEIDVRDAQIIREKAHNEALVNTAKIITEIPDALLDLNSRKTKPLKDAISKFKSKFE